VDSPPRIAGWGKAGIAPGMFTGEVIRDFAVGMGADATGEFPPGYGERFTRDRHVDCQLPPALR
jgi:hypothetical protein